MTEKPKLTRAQRREVSALHTQAWAVRGLQVAIVGLGLYLAIFEGRDWPAVLIALALAVWMQTQLPALPDWLEKQRPPDD